MEECESVPNYTLMSYIYPDSSQSVNFDAKTFAFLWNVLPEDNPAHEFLTITSSTAKCSKGYRIVVHILCQVPVNCLQNAENVCV